MTKLLLIFTAIIFSITANAGHSDPAEMAKIAERRKTEIATAMADHPQDKIKEKCGTGGVWGYFTQDPKHRVDIWADEAVKGDYKTFESCEKARNKKKNRIFTEKCEAKVAANHVFYEVAKASFTDSGGNDHDLYFSSMDKCQNAVKNGFYWFHESNGMAGVSEVVYFVDPPGNGSGSFNSECEVYQKNACTGPPLPLQQ